MKKSIIGFIIASIVIILSATKLSANYDEGTLDFKMTISSNEIQNSVEKIFIGKPGIIDVYIDRSKDLLSIMYDSFKLTDEDIYNIIRKAGYVIYAQKNTNFKVSEAHFKLDSQDSILIYKIEHKLLNEKNIVDVYFDSSNNLLNVLFVSDNNNEYKLAGSLVKCGMHNPIMITNSELKTLQAEKMRKVEIIL